MSNDTLVDKSPADTDDETPSSQPTNTLAQGPLPADAPSEPLAPSEPSSVDDLHNLIGKRVENLRDIPVKVSVILGRARLSVEDLIDLSAGSLIGLDRKIGEPIDILVNGRLVARGELVVIDENIGISITEIVKSDPISAS